MGGEVGERQSELQKAAAVISRFKKERFLRSLSEDEFRDKVVRPLFFRSGLRDGRDLCGPDEEGKDAVFLSRSLLGVLDVEVVQTKRGNLNLTSKAQENLENALTQLRTGIATPVVFTKTKEKKFPSKVILCTSGKINSAARKHIVDQLSDPRIQFLDSDELIPLIDERYPELWLGIESDVMPYMRELRRAIEQASENVAINELLPGKSAAATDAIFVDLYLWRPITRLRRHKGRVEEEPDIIEIPVTALPRKRERLVLILGEAGAGKSTTIRRLAYVLAGEALSGNIKLRIPILLRALDLSHSPETSLLEAALGETQKLSGSKVPVFSSDDLENGRVALFVDALDEVANDDGRMGVVKRILQFHQAYPGCLIVATSREYAFLRDLSDLAEFTQYRVEEISFKQAAKLVERLERKGSLKIQASKELIRRLEDIHGMELNPLLVTVFAATTEFGRQDIPANITELFKKFTELMLGRWDATKGFAHQFHAPLKDFILTKIAFGMHHDRVTWIGLAEFKARIAIELRNRGYAADVDQLMDEILNRSGLLRIVGNRVEFRHLLLQEFYAGRGIPSEELLEKLVSDDWWRRAIVFYFGDRPANFDALARIQKVLNSLSPTDRFTAAATLGLAIQASYLIPVNERISGIAEVIRRLSEVKNEVIEQMAGSSSFPMTGFIIYYLVARDSVAVSALETSAQPMLDSFESAAEEETETRRFWVIVGLLEAGLVTEAEQLMRGFRPRDPRLLLGIHLGCFLIQHIRVASDEQRKSATRISGRIQDEIAELRKKLLEEYKTHLLELRRDQIVALPEGSRPD